MFLTIGIILFVVGTFLVELESFGWATLMLIGTLVAAHLFHVADIIGFVTTNPLQAGLFALAYVVAGILWSFIKWFSYLINYRDKLRENKTRFLKMRNLAVDATASIPQELVQEFKRSGYYTTKPIATDNKARIMSWMAFFPLSIIGTLLNDPIRRVFEFCFKHFKLSYQRMADHVFRNDLELK